MTADKNSVSDRGNAVQSLRALGLHVDGSVVCRVLDILSRRTKGSLYDLYKSGKRRDGTTRMPVCGKGTIYKIKRLYEQGELDRLMPQQVDNKPAAGGQPPPDEGEEPAQAEHKSAPLPQPVPEPVAHGTADVWTTRALETEGFQPEAAAGLVRLNDMSTAQGIADRHPLGAFLMALRESKREFPGAPLAYLWVLALAHLVSDAGAAEIDIQPEAVVVYPLFTRLCQQYEPWRNAAASFAFWDKLEEEAAGTRYPRAVELVATVKSKVSATQAALADERGLAKFLEIIQEVAPSVAPPLSQLLKRALAAATETSA